MRGLEVLIVLCGAVTLATCWIDATTSASYSRKATPVDVSNSDSFVFGIKSPSDAIVGLQSEVGATNGQRYEIVIGGWDNTKAVIRAYSGQGNHLVEEDDWNGYLSNGEFRYFWISWSDGKIRVGRGQVVGAEELMSTDRDNMYSIKGISITGFNRAGTWKLQGYTGSSNVAPAPEAVSVYEVSTSAEYGHIPVPGYSVDGKTELKFEVKSTGDVFVGLTESESDSSQDRYEINIGGAGNRQSLIRRPKLSTGRSSYHYSSELDPQSFRPFWISWADNKIRVGRGTVVGQGEFLTGDQVTPSYPIRAVSVSNGWGNSGEYRFFP